MFEYDQVIVQALLKEDDKFRKLYDKHHDLKEKVRNAEIGSGLHHSVNGLAPFPVTHDAGQETLPGPAPVAVHDDGDMRGWTACCLNLFLERGGVRHEHSLRLP